MSAALAQFGSLTSPKPVNDNGNTSDGSEVNVPGVVEAAPTAEMNLRALHKMEWGAQLISSGVRIIRSGLRAGVFTVLVGLGVGAASCSSGAQALRQGSTADLQAPPDGGTEAPEDMPTPPSGDGASGDMPVPSQSDGAPSDGSPRPDGPTPDGPLDGSNDGTPDGKGVDGPIDGSMCQVKEVCNQGPNVDADCDGIRARDEFARNPPGLTLDDLARQCDLPMGRFGVVACNPNSNPPFTQIICQ